MDSSGRILLAVVFFFVLSMLLWNSWSYEPPRPRKRKRMRAVSPPPPCNDDSPVTYRCVCESNGAIAPKRIDPDVPIRVFSSLEPAIAAAVPERDYVVGGSQLHPLFYVVRIDLGPDDPVVPMGPPDSRVWVRTVG